MTDLYLGLISGTSIDGVDAAVIDLSHQQPQLIASHCHPIPAVLKQQIASLCNPTSSNNTEDPIDLLGEVDIALGQLFAEAAIALLKQTKVDAHKVKAIGSHGQTIRHRPPLGRNTASSTNACDFTLQSTRGFTVQIADPNTIAQLTGITTVADFRRRDMANGGQGAPFAPAFHQAISPAHIGCCAFLNLGGIANITVIENGQLVCGYDTGPANGLMDAWIYQHQQSPYDANGDWATSGTVIPTLLEELLADPYFQQPAPKSTGREYFNLEWVRGQRQQKMSTLPPADIQATLLALSVQTIGDELRQYQPQTVYCCGGGVHNHALMRSLKEEMTGTGTEVTDTATLGIAPDWIEAAAFAWLAKKHMKGESVDLRAVTGANKASVLGVRTG